MKQCDYFISELYPQNIRVRDVVDFLKSQISQEKEISFSYPHGSCCFFIQPRLPHQCHADFNLMFRPLPVVSDSQRRRRSPYD